MAGGAARQAAAVIFALTGTALQGSFGDRQLGVSSNPGQRITLCGNRLQVTPLRNLTETV